jgi:hypothetical protein
MSNDFEDDEDLLDWLIKEHRIKQRKKKIQSFIESQPDYVKPEIDWSIFPEKERRFWQDLYYGKISLGKSHTLPPEYVKLIQSWLD